MMQRSIAAALTLIAFFGGAAPAAAASANPVVAPQIRTLANGLRIVVQEDHAAPVVEVSTWYRFGSAYETAGKTGLAHALEHMLFRGTADVSSGGLDDWGARVGALVNAQTTYDSTHFFFIVPADRLDAAIHVEADRMRNAKLAPADWTVERGAVLQELAQRQSSPVGKLFADVSAALYPGSPYGRSVGGDPADVERASAADLRALYDTWYVPNDATLVVTGDVQPAAVFAAAERWFGPIAAKPLPPDRPQRVVPAKGAVVRETGEVPFGVLDLAYAAPPANGPTEALGDAAHIVAIALANPRAPLHAALVDSRLALNAQLAADSNRGAGTFHFVITLAPGHTAEEVRLVAQATMQSTLAAGIDPQFIEAAKTQVLRGLTYARDSVTSLDAAIGSQYVVPGDVEPTRYAALVATMKKPELDEYARRYFSEPNAVGILEPRARTGALAATDLGAGISDQFGGRVPDGAIVQAAWMRDDLARPLDVHSRVQPQRFTLPNGLELLVQRIADNPTVFVRGVIRTSPQFDPPGKEGLGAAASTMLNYGGAKYTTASARKALDDIGAQAAFGTSFFAHGLAADVPTLLDVLADSVTAPALPPDRWAFVRAQRLTQLSRRDTQPGYRAARALRDALYPPGDPVRREETAESMTAITLDDVRAYVKAHVRPDATTLVVVGDVDPAAVRDAVANAFGSWHADGPLQDPHLPPIPAPSPVRQLVASEARDVSVDMALPGPARTSPDYDALRVASEILGAGGFESRLFREAREKRGLVYGISSGLSAGRDRGTFSISFRSDPAKVDATAALVRAEIRRLRDTPVDPEELHVATTRLVAASVVGEQATATIASDLALIGLGEVAPDYYATLSSRYARVTAADVQRVARRWLVPEHLVEIRLGAAGPAGAAADSGKQ